MNRELPREVMSHLTMQVLDWQGPVVEIQFNRPIVSRHDVELVVEQASRFMDRHFSSGSGEEKVYFVTCYDGFSVNREAALALQESFIDFNRRYSLGDVRYGGSASAKTIIISTAIKSTSQSDICTGREQALERIRNRISDQELAAQK
jgi:hypothetical protein